MNTALLGLVSVCAASGLWLSCADGSDQRNVTLHAPQPPGLRAGGIFRHVFCSTGGCSGFVIVGVVKIRIACLVDVRHNSGPLCNGPCCGACRCDMGHSGAPDSPKWACVYASNAPSAPTCVLTWLLPLNVSQAAVPDFLCGPGRVPT
jgi:hypothetical protein